MKYLKKFDTHNEYETYIEDSPDLPNVSICIDVNDVHYNPIPKLNVITYKASQKLTENTNQPAYNVYGINQLIKICYY